MEEFKLAIKDNDIDSFKELLKKKDPSLDENFPIRYACFFNRVKMVKLLLKDPRVDPTVKNNHALRLSCYYGHTEVVKLLIKDKRMILSAEQNRAIKVAYKRNHKGIVRLLINDPRMDLNISERSIYSDMSSRRDSLKNRILYYLCLKS